MIGKKVLVLLLPLFLAVAVSAESLNEKTAQLEQKRKELELQMHLLRVELIKQNSEFNQLYQKILALHKELQLRIDATPAMKKLAQQAMEIDLELKDLEKPSKNDK